MDIKNMPIEALIPYEKNTKKHDDVQINNVAESIKQYGFVQQSGGRKSGGRKS